MNKLALCFFATFFLAACGQAPPSARPAAPTGNVGALGKSSASLPMPKSAPLVDGYAARRSSVIAERALDDYVSLVRRWERTYGDRAKDAIEEQMLRNLKNALSDVQDVTSRQGDDEADRRAYDIADRGLDRYEDLYREWRAAYSRPQARRIVNEMLTMLVDTLQSIRDNA